MTTNPAIRKRVSIQPNIKLFSDYLEYISFLVLFENCITTEIKNSNAIQLIELLYLNKISEIQRKLKVNI